MGFDVASPSAPSFAAVHDTVRPAQSTDDVSRITNVNLSSVDDDGLLSRILSKRHIQRIIEERGKHEFGDFEDLRSRCGIPKEVVQGLIDQGYKCKRSLTVDLNLCSAATLASCKGINKLAVDIVQERTLKGPYKDWEDLKGRVLGIGDARIRLLQQYRVVILPARPILKTPEDVTDQFTLTGPHKVPSPLSTSSIVLNSNHSLPAEQSSNISISTDLSVVERPRGRPKKHPVAVQDNHDGEANICETGDSPPAATSQPTHAEHPTPVQPLDPKTAPKRGRGRPKKVVAAEQPTQASCDLPQAADAVPAPPASTGEKRATASVPSLEHSTAEADASGATAQLPESGEPAAAPKRGRGRPKKLVAAQQAPNAPPTPPTLQAHNDLPTPLTQQAPNKPPPPSTQHTPDAPPTPPTQQTSEQGPAPQTAGQHAGTARGRAEASIPTNTHDHVSGPTDVQLEACITQPHWWEREGNHHAPFPKEFNRLHHKCTKNPKFDYLDDVIGLYSSATDSEVQYEYNGQVLTADEAEILRRMWLVQYPVINESTNTLGNGRESPGQRVAATTNAANRLNTWDDLKLLASYTRGVIPAPWKKRFRVDPYGNVVALDAENGAVCAFDVDHIFPWSRGGLSCRENFMAVHFRANRYVKRDHILNAATEAFMDAMQSGLSVDQFLHLVSQRESLTRTQQSKFDRHLEDLLLRAYTLPWNQLPTLAPQQVLHFLQDNYMAAIMDLMGREMPKFSFDE